MLDYLYKKALEELLNEQNRETKFYEVEYLLIGANTINSVHVFADSREIAIQMVKNPHRKILKATVIAGR